MLEEYKTKEPYIYKLINKTINNSSLNHAYLIDTSATFFKYDFVIDFAKVFLCPDLKNQNCSSCNICSRINERIYNELTIIKPDGLYIKKEQILKLKDEYNKTSLESKNRVYIIVDCEKMNRQAANSMLKFLEEPEEGIYALLITDYPDKVLETIKSRCQFLKLRDDDFNSIFEKYHDFGNKTLLKLLLMNNYEEDIDNLLLEENYLKILNLTMEIIRSNEHKSGDLIIKFDRISKILVNKNDLIFFLDTLIYFYKDLINFKNNSNIEIFEYYTDFISDVGTSNNNLKNINIIQDLINYKDEIYYNVNNKLLIDKVMFTLERS